MQTGSNLVASRRSQNSKFQVEPVYTSKAAKQRTKLPEKVRALLDLLSKQMELTGPIRRDWKNFSKLTGDNYHCHLKKGKPTYVACWKVVDKKIQIIEVYYAGTHENAPY